MNLLVMMFVFFLSFNIDAADNVVVSKQPTNSAVENKEVVSTTADNGNLDNAAPAIKENSNENNVTPSEDNSSQDSSSQGDVSSTQPVEASGVKSSDASAAENQTAVNNNTDNNRSDQSSNNDDQGDVDSSDKKDESVQLGVANVHQVDLDTININSGGNWLEKRIWYEKAEILFDSIRVMVGGVIDFRTNFSNEVNAIGQKIDSFYETVSFDKGQIDEMLQEFLNDFDNAQKMDGDLSEKERSSKMLVKKEQANLEQIGQDIKTIGDIDAKIDQTLMQAFKTINDCRDYETKSWNNFKSIGKELDDKKARSLYYEMSNFKDNIDQKNNYLRNTLLPYLHNTLVAKIENNIAQIKDSIKKLKDKGVDLHAMMESYQKIDIGVASSREKELSQINADKKAPKEDAAPKQDENEKTSSLPEKSTTTTVKETVLNAWNSLQFLIFGATNFVQSFFVSSKS